MSQGRPRLFISAQCAGLWRRYKSGESILGISRLLGGRQSAVHRALQSTGGIAPAPRRRHLPGTEELSLLTTPNLASQPMRKSTSATPTSRRLMANKTIGSWRP